MNNNVFNDLKVKVFQSGNPSYLYIGINTLIYVVVALINVPFFLSGNGGLIYDDFIREHFAFPANILSQPLQFYTIFTYQFFHDGFFHVLFNMLWLYWMGRIFLDFLKPRQFHFVYLVGGLLGGVLFAVAFNIFPVFRNAFDATIIGSSAAVMAIVVATATLVPNYSISLLLFGEVKLKYLAIAYVVLDLIGSTSANAGGSFAHLGGAFFGFAYIKALQSGTDWSAIFKKRPKLRVVNNKQQSSRNDDAKRSASRKNEGYVDQREIDEILDKISKTGYDKLSKEEKETLFKASKH
ncbi:MAG: rhomboid family intramembrane serine protease [Pedobacter sp.]|nr:MAG: rhomboid family intramembrane serine protease [Pedobacter sp.]